MTRVERVIVAELRRGGTTPPPYATMRLAEMLRLWADRLAGPFIKPSRDRPPCDMAFDTNRPPWGVADGGISATPIGRPLPSVQGRALGEEVELFLSTFVNKAITGSSCRCRARLTKVEWLSDVNR